MRRVVVAIGAVCVAWFSLSAARAEPSAAQAARLAELRPDSVHINRGSDKVFIRGGDLGRFDPQVSPEENLRRLIVHLGLLHEAAPLAQFTVTEQMPTFVRFAQLIDGIPVSARNEVALGANGLIVEARLSVVDPARAPQGQRISRERAIQIASAACAARNGVASTEVELGDYPGLHYKPTALGQPLLLRYGFYGRATPCGSDVITVDALSGAVEIASAVYPVTPNEPPGRPASTA